MNQYADSIQLNPWYTWLRARQLEGTYPGDPQTGVWPISSMRVAYGWGNVPDAIWHYDPPARVWPPIEPEGVDQAAKAHRILYYQRIRNLSDCKLTLARPHPVGAAFEITKQWFTAPGGRIEIPRPDDKVIGTHAILLLDPDEDSSEVKFVSSWGDAWGDRGFGYLPYSYFDERVVSAWTFEIHRREDEVTDFIQYLQLGYRTHLGDYVHVREIYDSQDDERLAWTIGVQRGSMLDVEDLFVRPAYRKKGYGRELCEMLTKLIRELNLQIRVWLSHADEDGPVQRRLCEYLGLTIKPSPVRWAKFLADNRASPVTSSKRLRRPAIWSGLGHEPQIHDGD